MKQKHMVTRMIRMTYHIFVACLVVCAGRAEGVGLYSIVTNPGENASTEMNIGWHSDVDLTNTFVSYTKKSDAAWKNATRIKGASTLATVFRGIPSKSPSGADLTEDAVFLDWGVTLTSLEPDTDYMYKIGSGDLRSPVYSFKTAGAKAFSFFWLGDFHAYTPLPGRLRNAVKLIDAAERIDPDLDFIFSTGDVVAWGGSYSFWKDMYEQDFIRKYMFANVVGNHDAMTRTGSISSEFFRVTNNNPTNGYAGQEGVCYWFIYGKVLFITLNNEIMVRNPVAEQAAKAWAAQVIDRARSKYDYIFLCEHYQWFDGRAGKASWYENWREFCDKHKVALALSGNNHVYQRSHSLHQDKVVPGGQGTIYMVVPSSDGERGVKAGTLTYNAEKLAYTYSSQNAVNGQVKTIGGILVAFEGDQLTTKLVYREDDEYQVADEYSARLLRAR
jgi:hypothetical protein